jgi:hypothetical protein
VDFSGELFLQIAAYVGSAGVVYGGLSARLKELEKKMDRHNGLMQDMAAAKICIGRLENQVDRIEAKIFERNFDAGGFV